MSEAAPAAAPASAPAFAAPASAARPAGWELVLLTQALILAAAVRLAWWSFDLDDAFITYAYSQSLAGGAGFTFGGQKSLGTTTPLFALLLVPAAWVGLPLPTAAKAIGLLASLGSCALLFALLRRAVGPWPAVAGALLLAMNVRHAAMAMSGMETALYVAVCLGALVAHQHRRTGLSATLAGAAVLMRPDGLILAGVLAAAHLWARRPLRPAALLGFVLPVAAWTAFAWVEFGSPIPASVTAKLAYPEYGSFRLEAALESLGPDLRWPLGALALVGFGAAVVRRREVAPLAWWTAAYLLIFLRAPNFPWYYVPAIPGLIALALTGVDLPLRLLARGEDSRRLALAAALVPALVAGWATATEAREFRRRMDRVYGPGVTQAYHSLALWLRDETPAPSVIGVPEVGYVGYYSRRRVLDLAGLCSPAVIPYLPGGRYVDIVRDFRPDYVALTTEPGRPLHNTISESPWFREHYAACKKFRYRGGHWYIVYRQVGPAPAGRQGG